MSVVDEVKFGDQFEYAITLSTGEDIKFLVEASGLVRSSGDHLEVDVKPIDSAMSRWKGWVDRRSLTPVGCADVKCGESHYKVGDWVALTKSPNTVLEWKGKERSWINRVGKIIQSDSSAIPFFVEFKERNPVDDVWVTAKEIRLATLDEIADACGSTPDPAEPSPAKSFHPLAAPLQPLTPHPLGCQAPPAHSPLADLIANLPPGVRIVIERDYDMSREVFTGEAPAPQEG